MKSLKSAILKELDKAIQDASGSEQPFQEIVHTLRRRGKRIRAYLCLLPHCQGKVARRTRRKVRQAAFALSATRDSQVMIPVYAQFKTRLAEVGVEQTQIDTMESILRDRADLATSDPTATLLSLENFSMKLRKAYQRILSTRTKRSSKSILLQLKRTYRCGHQLVQQEIEKMCSKDFHELRKTTKQLYYQLQFVASALKIELNKEIVEARALGDRLGDALNLSVLAETLTTFAEEKVDSKAIRAGIAESREQMIARFAQALPLACQLFFETPNQFARRLSKLL
jgi:CHAD domain-containing protein